ncbi:MAG: hypothetical protein QOF83_2113 [Solirubrobacteraceae bacterium]|nr:hypothetical protein [Solirubrobacteraceae bacterium]
MDEPLAVLVLPSRLERFALEAHARELLAIPRVVALEPSRVATPRFLREATALRQASRLRWPGTPRLLVLYHPAQYPLARALGARHEAAELWYLPPDRGDLTAEDSRETAELGAFDELARERAAGLLSAAGHDVADESLRLRLRELDVINPRPFLPRSRLQGH